MKLDSLKKLYIEELRDLYSAENQIVKALPKMAKAAKASELQEAFRSHLEETKNQVTRLTTIFENLGVSPKGKSCKAMEGLLAERRGTDERGRGARGPGRWPDRRSPARRAL